MAHPMPLGAKPRQPDPRDWMMASILPQTALTQRTWDRPVRTDQGAYGTCVANAWTHFLTGAPIQHPDKKLLDPEKQPNYNQLGSSAYWPNGWQALPIAASLYAVRLYDAIHDGTLENLDPERDDGANPVNGAVVLKRRGLISGYYRASSVDDVIQAVLTKAPVVFASPWYSSMDNTPKMYGDNRYVDVNVSSGIRGYHAYLIDAVNLAPSIGPPFVRLNNSWGIMWGTKGAARVTVENLHTLYIQNAWIATELPSA